MKTIHNTIIVIIVLSCLISIVQIATSQTQPKFIFKHVDFSGGFVMGLSFSHDNTKLITNGGMHTMMWDLKTGELIMRFPENSGFGAVDFSQDDKMIVTSYDVHAYVAIWDAQTGNEIKIIKGELDSTPPTVYTAVTFSRDGEKVLCGDENGSLYVIDITQEKVVQKFKYLGGYMKNIQTFPDGVRVVASSSIVSLQSGEIIRKFDSPIFLSYDGRSLFKFSVEDILGNWFFTTYELDSNTYNKKNEYTPFLSNGTDQAISPNGKFIACSGRTKADAIVKEIPRIINLETNKTARTFAVEGTPDDVFDMVKFSRDGNMVAFVKGDTVYLYDISGLTAGVKGAETMQP